MSNKLIDKMLITDSQLKIIQSNIYPMYVKAGAGTGKTEVLIRKILHILINDIEADLENIVIISFTNKATEEIKKRISITLEKECKKYYTLGNLEIYNKLKKQLYLVDIANISTIHSFCENIIREFGLEVNCSTNFKFSSYKSKIKSIINNYVRNLFNSGALYSIDESTFNLALFELYMSNNDKGIYEVNNISVNPFSISDVVKEQFINSYNNIVSLIERKKFDENILTPNDAIKKADETLQDISISKQISKKYKYVFIDEYQDTNISQFSFTKSLIKSNIKVFLVGDEKQAIYGFRGSDVKNSINMSNFINKSRLNDCFLFQNFRSDPKIIEYINRLFSKKFFYFNEIIEFDHSNLLIPDKSKNSEKDPVEIYEGEDITEVIKKLLGSKSIKGKSISYSDIAILCRKNYMVDIVGEKCKSVGMAILTK